MSTMLTKYIQISYASRCIQVALGIALEVAFGVALGVSSRVVLGLHRVWQRIFGIFHFALGSGWACRLYANRTLSQKIII